MLTCITFFVCPLRNKDICTELSRPVNNFLLILYTHWQLTNVNITIQLLFQRCIYWQNDMGNIISIFNWKSLDYLISKKGLNFCISSPIVENQIFQKKAIHHPHQNCNDHNGWWCQIIKRIRFCEYIFGYYKMH